MTMLRHVFSVDVEEYFHVNAFEGIVQRDAWESYPARAAASVHEILDLLARRGATGTFFTLGWLARRDPALVRAIADAGHEIASHGHWHRRIPTLTPDAFRADVRDAKAALEDVTGTAVVGFRAPSFSIIPGFEWGFEILVEEGHTYDSSRFPIRRRGYGSPDAPLVPHTIATPAGDLMELPLATARFAGMRVPAAGGGYLRQFPFAVIRRAFQQATTAGVPAMFYIHPWEIDAEQPRIPVSLLTRVRHYRGLHKTLPLLDRLLMEFPFASALDAFPALRGAAV